jgi:hypothetical protein
MEAFSESPRSKFISPAGEQARPWHYKFHSYGRQAAIPYPPEQKYRLRRKKIRPHLLCLPDQGFNLSAERFRKPDEQSEACFSFAMARKRALSELKRNLNGNRYETYCIRELRRNLNGFFVTVRMVVFELAKQAVFLLEVFLVTRQRHCQSGALWPKESLLS